MSSREGIDVPYPETLGHGRYVSRRVLKDLVSKARQLLQRILWAALGLGEGSGAMRVGTHHFAVVYDVFPQLLLRCLIEVALFVVICLLVVQRPVIYIR